MKKLLPSLAVLRRRCSASRLPRPPARSAASRPKVTGTPQPQTGAWQWQLQGKFKLTPGADVYDIDAFESTVGDVRAIHRHRAKAICYVDVGSWEEYRPDAGRFPESVLGERYEGYPEERWLDIRHFHEFAAIMEHRLRNLREEALRRGRARQHRRLGKQDRLPADRAPTSFATTAGSPIRSTSGGWRWR